MSMAQITAAGESMNACATAFNGKKDEIDAALVAAQAGYAALSANLKAVVSDVMNLSITFDPAALEADLIDGGTFRNWPDLMIFIQAAAAGSRVVIRMPSQATLTSTSLFEPRFWGNRHLVFQAINPQVEAQNRPVYKAGIYDKIVNNQWWRIDPGEGGSVIFENVDITFDTNINAAIPYSTANGIFFFWRDSYFPVSLINCNVIGLAGHTLATITDASNGSISLWNVNLQGPIVGFSRYQSSGTGRLGTFMVTLSGGATLHSNFTAGTNLLLG